MYRKCLVMEIKERYALVLDDEGTVIKIKLKENMKTGDKIYVLPEDIYVEKENIPVVPFITKHKDLFKSMTVMAATALICFIIAISSSNMGDAYAKVMIDGSKSIEFIVDDNYEIIEAISKDGSFSEEELRSFEGRNLNEIKTRLGELLKNSKITTGYEIIGDEKENITKEDIEKYLDDMFGEDVLDVDEIYDDIVEDIEEEYYDREYETSSDDDDDDIEENDNDDDDNDDNDDYDEDDEDDDEDDD